MAKKFVGWRYATLVGGLVGMIGLALYPVALKPMYDSETRDYYRNISSTARRDIRQEDIQPGNMKVWSDPFDRKNN